jgi:hypothetical protein
LLRTVSVDNFVDKRDFWVHFLVFSDSVFKMLIF